MTEFDVVVIGTGPGGYVCAVRAAQLGLSVAVVEKRAQHGGTCLNVGCIPSKALLHASEVYEDSGRLDKMGIELAGRQLNLPQMMAFKDQAVKGNTAGVAYLLKKNKIAVFQGTGTLTGHRDGFVEIAVSPPLAEHVTLKARHTVIATGSQPVALPGISIDEKRVVSSTGALAFSQVPKHLLVIGGGVIGLELGSVWRRLGARVTVVEYLDQILAGMDSDVAKTMARLLQKQGMTFELGQKLVGMVRAGDALQAKVEPSSGGQTRLIEADRVLVAVGRRAYTDGLGLKDIGVRLDNHGRVIVDQNYATNVEGISAIGDVIAGPMLAHKAAEEGIALAEILAGQAGQVNYRAIPSVIYTDPEAASVGRSEDDLKQAGMAYNVGKIPFMANGRAKANQQTNGFVKVLADAKTDRVLGVHIVGAQASEMIAEATVLLEFSGSAEDLARICHAHPTLSEAVREAALACASRAIHA